MIIIFDYDGTLHNTAHLYGSAFRKTYSWLVEQGLAAPHTYTDEDTAGYLGMTAMDMWNLFMPELSDEMKMKAAKMVGAEMIAKIGEGDVQLYEGVTEMLDELKAAGHTLVILSNCGIPYMNAHRAEVGLDRWFSKYYCGGEYPGLKKSEIFRFIEKDFGALSEGVKYAVAGDRASDLESGKINGFPAIGCSYGFGESEELDLADIIIKTPGEIPGVIEGLLDR